MHTLSTRTLSALAYDREEDYDPVRVGWKITVLDRPRLEELVCECYSVVRRETERLLPHVPFAPGR